MAPSKSDWPIEALLAVLCLVILTPLTAAAERGIVVSRYQLLLDIDLETGERRLIGELDRDIGVSRLSYSRDGRLYGVGREAVQNWLFEISTVDAKVTVWGQLPSGDTRGLAFDDRGRLWFGVENDLYEVDRETGATVLAATFSEPLRYFSSDGIRLVGFQLTDERLMTLDLETFEITPLFETHRMIGVFDSAFGKTGKLWVTGSVGGILVGTDTAFGRIDLVEETFDRAFQEHVSTSNPEAGMYALAIPPAETVIEIPTLDRRGLALTASLIAVLATALLCRRRLP